MAKTIFISGAATGIGAATARRFAAAGWNCVLADINAEGGSALAVELGPCAIFVQADTRRRDEVEAAVALGIEAFGAINSLFANAGIHRRHRLLTLTDQDFDLVIKTNIYGTVNTLRAVVPAIIAAGGGTVVINASDQAFIGKPGNFTYGLTKGALAQITKSAALELASAGVRVNAVCPGTVKTPMVDKIFSDAAGTEEKDLARMWAQEDALFPLGRTARPAEIAEAVFFLASEASSFCTGTLLAVDGGLTAG